MTTTLFDVSRFGPPSSLDESSSQIDLREEDMSGTSDSTLTNPESGETIAYEEPNPTPLATEHSTHDQKRTGETWMTTVITTWLQQWLNLWKMRNEDRHGRDGDTRRQAQDNQTIRETTKFYEEYSTRVNPTLQWLFEIPLTKRIQGNISTLRIWLRTWKPVVEKSYATSLETG
jgi:hypothetical protein